VVYTQTAMFGPLLFDELGLTPDPAMPRISKPRGWDILSVERLASLQAEHIFTVVESDSERYFNSVADTAVWQQIPAVRNHRVHVVAASTWIGGDGVLANEAIFRDVLGAIAPEGTP
jgi:iron complex transport system substrate-binding protein